MTLKEKFETIAEAITPEDKKEAESIVSRPTIDKYISGDIVKIETGEMLFNFFYERIQARAMKMATV